MEGGCHLVQKEKRGSKEGSQPRLRRHMPKKGKGGKGKKVKDGKDKGESSNPFAQV